MGSVGSFAAELTGRAVGSYRVVRLLGSGAMGKVYLLEHTRLPNTFAALKVLSPRRGNATLLRERFVQEAMVAAAIGGDRVARPLDIGHFDDDTPYIIMEYIEGRTVGDAIDASGPLPVPTALAIAYRVADTIALAHARGIVHRDVKPSNIMLVDEGLPRVKVLDFGVARAVGDIKIAQTLESAVIGSPGYMSPEAATGMIVDERTDVFSLAVTLFKMLTGRLPFSGDNPQALVAAILTQSPLRLGDARPAGLDAVPPPLEEVMARALHKNAAERPTMPALRDALFALLAESAPAQAAALRSESAPHAPPLAREVDVLGATLQPTTDSALVRAQVERFAAARMPSSTAPSPSPSVPRWRWPLLALLVVLAGGALATVVLRRPTSRPPPPRPSRHVIASQRQLTTSGNVSDCALSPDGKTLAYSDGGTLYLRELASDRSRAIADKLIESSLFWSPDSKQLYFDDVIADRSRAQRVARDGGAPVPVPWLDQELGDVAPDGAQMALTNYPARAITFTDDKGHPLEKIALEGSFTFLYSARYSPTGDRLLVVTRTGEDRSARLITRDGTQQVALPFEHLAQIDWYDASALWLTRHEETTMAGDLLLQPLDQSGLHVAGEPRLVLPQIHGKHFSVARSGGNAAYVSTQLTGAAVWTVTVGADGKAQPRRLDFGTALTCDASLAPDGSRLAVSISDGQHAVIELMPFAGGEQRQLARMSSCPEVGWSPDSKRLAWREGAGLVVGDADSGTLRRLALTNASGGDDQVVWAGPDRVLYHVEGHKQWRSIDVTSGAITPLTPGNNGWYFDPVLSPDGKRVVVLWNRRDARGLWTIDLTDGSEHFLGGAALARATGWSSDGKFVYLQDASGATHAEPLRILRLPAGGGAAQPWLTLPLSSARSECQFARDGQRAVCVDASEHGDLWLIDNFGELVEAAR